MRIKPIYQASFWRELLFDLEDCMGEAKRRGDFEARKAESEFFAKEKERLNKWLFDNRPVVVSRNTHGGTTRRKTSSMQRALLIAALSGIGAFVADKDGNRLTT